MDTKLFDIVSPLVKLNRSGQHHVGLCPFHEEKTPSFFVFDSRWKCFGCGQGGDVVSFVMLYYNVSFKEAMKRLGRDTFKHYEVARRCLKRGLVDEFRAWEAIYIDELSMLIRVSRKTIKKFGSELFNSNPDFYSYLLNSLDIYSYYYNILLSNNDAIKYELYKKTGDRAHSPKRIFKDCQFIKELI